MCLCATLAGSLDVTLQVVGAGPDLTLDLSSSCGFPLLPSVQLAWAADEDVVSVVWQVRACTRVSVGWVGRHVGLRV